jgi:hypothetical protein
MRHYYRDHHEITQDIDSNDNVSALLILSAVVLFAAGLLAGMAFAMWWLS